MIDTPDLLHFYTVAIQIKLVIFSFFV